MKSIKWDDSESVTGNRLEIKVTFPAGSTSTVGLTLRDDEHEYPLTVDFASGELHVLHEKCKLECFDPSEPLNLHIFIDHSVVEVFVNERESLSTWLRPVFADNGAWRIRLLSPANRIEAWQLADQTKN
jgi:sucrose-6-phosphate hydrolase SacC (GH32 family)